MHLPLTMTLKMIEIGLLLDDQIVPIKTCVHRDSFIRMHICDDSTCILHLFNDFLAWMVYAQLTSFFNHIIRPFFEKIMWTFNQLIQESLQRNFQTYILGWHDFPESLKFLNFKTFPRPLGPKDYRELKLSKIFDRLALPNRDWNLCIIVI